MPAQVIRLAAGQQPGITPPFPALQRC